MKKKTQPQPKQEQPKESNVMPGSVTPSQALDNLRSTLANAVLFAWSDGTKTGLTLAGQTNVQQWFALVKAALPK